MKADHDLSSENKIEIDAEKSSSFTTIYGKVYDYYLSDEIEEPSHYTEWFNQMRNTNDTDIIRIHINSPGGDLYTAVQFVHVLADTKAHIEIHVEGACMSAATMIFMMGDEFFISPYTTFMIHNYHGGLFGKGNEIINQAMHERIWSSNIFQTIYRHFLSPEEIAHVIADNDIWMDRDDVVRRLNFKYQKMQEEIERREKETTRKEKKNSKKSRVQKTKV